MPHASAHTPYLQVVDFPRRMAGAGAPQRTVFGVLGHTKETGLTKSLGGLVVDSKTKAPAPPTMKDSKRTDKTEHHIAGSASKTHIPGAHYGQVPYPGVYMSELGKAL